MSLEQLGRGIFASQYRDDNLEMQLGSTNLCRVCDRRPRLSCQG